MNLVLPSVADLGEDDFPGYLVDAWPRIQQYIEQLERAVARLRKDAERYQWLRDNVHCDTVLVEIVPLGHDWSYPSLVLDAAHLDATIDAAMEAARGD